MSLTEVVDKAESDAVFRKLFAQPENKNPTWASSTYGIFICIDCAAHHRNLGVHKSFVRSVQLDSWKRYELKTMEIGGNARARDFFRKHGGYADAKEGKFSDAKYNSRAAELYKAKLKAEIEGGAKVKKSAFEEFAERVEQVKIEEEEKKTQAQNNGQSSTKSSPAMSLKTSDSPTLRNSPSASVLGAKKPTKKGFGGASKKTDFDFDDWDSIEDQKEEEKPPVKEDRSVLSKLGYYDDDEYGSAPTKKSSYSSSSSSHHTTSTPILTPAERQQRASVGSDSFVPQRSKAAIEAERPKDVGYGFAQQNFAKAKHISSTQFFGEENKEDEFERKQRLNRFEGATSISRDESDIGPKPDAGDLARRLAYTAKSDLGNVKDVLSNTGKKLSDMANNFFAEWSDRY